MRLLSALIFLFGLTVLGTTKDSQGQTYRLKALIVHEFIDERPSGKPWDPRYSRGFDGLPDMFARITYNGDPVKGISATGDSKKKFGKTNEVKNAIFDNPLFLGEEGYKPIVLFFEHNLFLDGALDGYAIKLVDQDQGAANNDTMVTIPFSPGDTEVQKAGYLIEIQYHDQ